MKKFVFSIFNMLVCTLLMAQSEDTLRLNFVDPPLENRMNINQHDLSTNTTTQNDYFDITLKKNGYGGMATNVCRTDYLDSPENFAAFCTGVRTAKNKGYDVWLYDEKLYPSGMADNKILSDHPDWEAEGLLIFKKSVTEGQTVSIQMPGTLILANAVPVVDDTIQYENAQNLAGSFIDGTFTWEAPAGTWKVVVVTQDVLYTGYQAGTVRGSETPHYPSLLMSEVAQSFIEYTHKRYAEAFGEKLGNYFTSTFTDEPSTMALPYSQLGYGVYPWKQVVSDSLKVKYGYDLKDKLLELTLDTDSDGNLLRYQYFKTISDLISQNYFGAIRDYCHSQDFLSGGHLLLEESLVAHVPLYGNIMACYRKMDIPGVDCLTGLPDKTRTYMFSSRLASSSSELEGNSRVMFESCPIDNDLPDEQEPATIYVKGVHNRMMVGGVTDFNNYLKLSYETFDGRKSFNDYTARVISLLSGGYRASRIAVYYPIETMWTKFKPLDMRLDSWWNVKGADPEAQSIENLMLNLTYGLYDNGWEFSYIDAQGLEEAVVSGNEICHGEGLKWDVLILPYTEVLPKQAYDKIIEFINNGGKVIALKKLPINSDTEFPSSEITSKFIELNQQNKIIFYSSFDAVQLNAQLEKFLVRDISFDSYSGVMYSHKLINKKDVFFIINDTNGDKTLTINLSDKSQWELWDPQTGKITSVSSNFTRSFGAYESIIIRTATTTQSSNSEKNGKGIKVYPNPTKGLLNISRSFNSSCTIEVINLSGGIEKRFKNITDRFDISSLNNGSYIVQITADSNVYNQLINKN